MMRISAILWGIALAAPAWAGPLTIQNVFFTDSLGLTITNTGTRSRTISGTTAAGWSISGELCVDGFCGGAAGPQTPVPVLRFTNADIHCTLVGASCGSLDFSMQATGIGGTVGNPLNMTFAADGSVSGTGTVSGYVSGWAFSSSPNAVVQYNLNQGSGFSFGPQSASTSFGVTSFGGYIWIHIDGLSQGSSLLFPNSLTVAFDDQSAGTGVPEPSSWTLLGVGVLGLIARRRRPK